MEEIESKGKTVAEAIEIGLKELGIEKSQAEIKILDEGNAGLFGLMGSRPARVKIRKIAKDLCPDYRTIQEQLKKITADLLTLMKVKYSEIRTTLLTGRIGINIISDDASTIIGKDGQTLKSLEAIIKLILWKNPAYRVKFSLDCAAWRQKKEEKIIEKAKEIAALVKKTGQPQHLQPMPAAERRLVHGVFTANSDIETISEGDGEERHIVIRPRARK